MKEKFKKMFLTSIIYSIAFIAFGLLLLFVPTLTISVISYIIGGVIIVTGIISFVRYFKGRSLELKVNFDLIYALLSVIAGVVIVLNPTALASLIPIILGIWIVINSAFKFQYAFHLKERKYVDWFWPFILSILGLMCGVILIFNPFRGVIVLTQLLGIAVIVYAIIDMIETFTIRKGMMKVVDLLEDGVTIVESEVSENEEK